MLRILLTPTLLYKDSNLERPGTITHFNQINNPPAKMGSRKPWLSLTSFCVVFAMLVAVTMSDSSWSSTPVKDSVALEPTPPPTTGAGDGGSATAESNPHLFTTPFLLPIIIGLSALFQLLRLRLKTAIKSSFQCFDCNSWVTYFYLGSGCCG